jgi:hypothetical protein
MPGARVSGSSGSLASVAAWASKTESTSPESINSRIGLPSPIFTSTHGVPSQSRKGKSATKCGVPGFAAVCADAGEDAKKQKVAA